MSHRAEREENVLKTFLVKEPAGAWAIPTETEGSWIPLIKNKAQWTKSKIHELQNLK